MRKRYADWSEEYPNHLILVRAGLFYMSWGRSAEILNEILDYKLAYSSKRNIPYTGGTSLSVIQDALSHNHINYIVIEGDNIIDRCEFPFFKEVVYNPNYFKKENDSNMNIKISDEDIIYTIEMLLEGVDPTTGEVLDENHIIHDLAVQAALSLALKSIQSKQTREKKPAPLAGTPWSQVEDLKLVQEYKSNLSIDEMAKLHGRTLGAIKSRLLHLGLIEQ